MLQSKEEILLPKLTRKVTIKAMYERYKDLVNDDDENIKLATFYKICKILTSSDQGMLTLIDYVTLMLVNETCKTLQNIIHKAVTNKHRHKCTNYVKVAKNFMKISLRIMFQRMMMIVFFHEFLYALSRDYIDRENNNDNGCKLPFFVCNHIKQLVINNDFIESDWEHIQKDAVQVIDDIAQKFKLFLAHQTRCGCQQSAIAKIENDIKELCVRSNGSTINSMIIIDFKMKYEIKSSRESSVEHYGKRGLTARYCKVGYGTVTYRTTPTGTMYQYSNT